MSQTVLNYITLFFASFGQKHQIEEAVVTGAADLVAGDVLILDTGKFRQAITADLVLANPGYRILLEDAAVTGGDKTVYTGVTGAIYEDKLVFTGANLAYSEALRAKLQISGIDVHKGTSSAQIAGEGA
ncbi:hypothetical protein KAR91_73645 [Candidatus Pacearchaeota archaeon]|nr:hypothetical protein [Candidatus Pacearchaeota archaeon]